jgi:hypothetical protein
MATSRMRPASRHVHGPALPSKRMSDVPWNFGRSKADMRHSSG